MFERSVMTGGEVFALMYCVAVAAFIWGMVFERLQEAKRKAARGNAK